MQGKTKVIVNCFNCMQLKKEIKNNHKQKRCLLVLVIQSISLKSIFDFPNSMVFINQTKTLNLLILSNTHISIISKYVPKPLI